VLPLRAELWSGSPTKTRLPKPANVGVRDCPGISLTTSI
jgi:hypothetical protein